MATADNEEKLFADLTALFRRAIALGQQHEREAVRSRLMVAIEGVEAEERPPATVSRPANKAASAPIAEVKRPYGFVKRTVARAIYDAGYTGISKHEIRTYCSERLDADLSESAIQTALSSLSESEMARYSATRNRWKMTPKLSEQIALEERENGDARELETQGRRAD